MIKKLLNSKFKKDLAFSYFTQGITIGFGFIQLFLINKYFGVATYGQLAIIIATAGIFSALLTARSSEAITRFFTREMLNHNYENAKFILSIGFVIDLITALLLLFITYLLSDFIAKTFIKNVEYSNEVFLYSFVVFFGFLRGTLFGYLQSKEMFVQINIISVFESIVKILAFLFVIFILKETSLREIILVFIVTSISSFMYTIVVFFKKYMIQFSNVKYNYNKDILKEYWSFNLKTFFSSSLKAGNDQIDILVLSYFTSAYTIGIYSIFKKILSIFSVVISQISAVTFTQIIKLYESHQFSQMLHNIKRKTLLIFSLITPMFIVSIVLLSFIFTYMNVSFNEMYYVAFVILFLKVITSALMWWWRAFIITYNPTIPIYINTLNLVNTILIPIILFNTFTQMDSLLLISISNILIIIPMGIIGYYYFYKYIFSKAKNG